MSQQLSKIQKVNEAFEIHQDLIKLGNAVGQAFILIGERLKQIKENNLFKQLGEGGYETFDSYLASPELQISRRQAYYLLGIYNTYIKKLGFSIEEMKGAKWSALKETLSVVNEQNKDYWLTQSKVNTVSGIKIEIKKESKGIKTFDCKHKWKKVQFWKCLECGELTYIRPKKK